MCANSNLFSLSKKDKKLGNKKDAASVAPAPAPAPKPVEVPEKYLGADRVLAVKDKVVNGNLYKEVRTSKQVRLLTEAEFNDEKVISSSPIPPPPIAS